LPAPAINIWGVTDAVALDAAIAARAEYVGLNFHPPSPRFAAPQVAAALAARNGSAIRRVGVFVDADDATIAEAVAAGKLAAIQLHGGETPGRAAQVSNRFGLPVWKVLSVASAADVARAEAYADAADFLLFDAKTPTGALPGGMGLAFDWRLLAGYRGRLPWGLAGGLSPENVAEAVRITRAPLVDTASGVESAPGVKAVDRIAAFCKAARR
jgi:phosphoribosylanthranilate isomerase